MCKSYVIRFIDTESVTMKLGRGSRSHGCDVVEGHPRAVARWPDLGICDVAEDSRAVSAIGLQQFEHALVTADSLALERPTDHVREVIVADRYCVSVTKSHHG